MQQFVTEQSGSSQWALKDLIPAFTLILDGGDRKAQLVVVQARQIRGGKRARGSLRKRVVTKNLAIMQAQVPLVQKLLM
eukprot:1154222-Pelagomonas_calceolata.AAC.3